MKKLYLLVFLLSITLFALSFGHDLFKNDAKSVEIPTLDLLQLKSVPQRKSTELAKLNLEDHNLAHIGATSFYVMDVGSGAVLAEKNSLQEVYPASTTKMMTAILARENYQLEEIVKVDKASLVGGNSFGLIDGEEISVESLLWGLLLPSGNDSAFALANHDREGLEGFVEKMNNKAKFLNLTGTYFQNPAGFDHPEHISNARDLAILAKELIKDHFLATIVSSSDHQISDIDGNNIRYIKNTNYLLGKINGVKGIKTGTTHMAGEVLVTLVERDGHEIIIALLASKDRFRETEQIIDWIYNNYVWVD